MPDHTSASYLESCPNIGDLPQVIDAGQQHSFVLTRYVFQTIHVNQRPFMV